MQMGGFIYTLKKIRRLELSNDSSDISNIIQQFAYKLLV